LVERSPDGQLFKFKIKLENGEVVLIDAGMLTGGGSIALMWGYETKEQLEAKYVAIYGEKKGKEIAERIVTLREALSIRGVAVSALSPENSYQIHDGLMEFEIPTENALYFRFNIEGAQTWEIIRLSDGRYFLKNQKGELREIKEGEPILFRDSNSETVLILAVQDGKLKIQDSSINGILYDRNFHPVAAEALGSAAPAVSSLTVETLSETVPDINYINDVILSAQVGEVAPGIIRPAAADGTPGALV